MAMDPLSLLIVGKTIDKTWDIFSDPVKKYVTQLFERRPDNTKTITESLVTSDAVATGVAIGYFHNFLKPLDGAIAYDRFLVFKNDSKIVEQQIKFTPEQYKALGQDGIKQMCEQKTEKYECIGSYDSDAFTLTIVYPAGLDNQNFSRVKDFLRSKERGSYYNRPNARPYGLNYTVQESPSKHNVRNNGVINVIDYARPIEAIYKYYKEDKNYSESEIEQVQKEEIELFLATVCKLMRQSTTHLFSKAGFRTIE